MALERTTIERALREADGNIGKAARALGASRRTLQNRMRSYGMARGKPGRRKKLLPYGRGKRVALGATAAVAALAVGGLALRRLGRSTRA